MGAVKSLEEARNRNESPQNIRSAEEKVEKIAKAEGNCRYVLVEVTPACDYANNKCEIARFAAGVLVDENEQKSFKIGPAERAFLWEIGPITLGGENGLWHIVLNARLWAFRPWPRRTKANPACRLREEPLVDLQHWLASHASRPGHFAVR